MGVPRLVVEQPLAMPGLLNIRKYGSCQGRQNQLYDTVTGKKIQFNFTYFNHIQKVLEHAM